MLALALLGVSGSSKAAEPCSSSDVGCAIFYGKRAVPAELRDDNRLLPGATTRCVNCHTRTASPDSFAPPLTPGYLFAAASRRGGPASSYDEPAFCRVLREGIDPADVMLRKAMPHYRISDPDCKALWHFLTQP
ncbi:hypothetical protein [Paraburkholderia sp. BCC1886]|uniref:hypothetical protein n=1 Tax=Paraburkholderia sp. BCC1886 TaxID=2562670 RepID=UPI0021B19D13|nr:hypothetical protein [Paraburkholderia sp. BCC1886]